MNYVFSMEVHHQLKSICQEANGLLIQVSSVCKAFIMKPTYFLSICSEFSEEKLSILCYMAYQKRQKVSHNSNGYEHRKVELIDKGSCKYKKG